MIRRLCFLPRLLLAACLLFGSQAVIAKIETHRFDTPQQENLYKQLIAELRCLVCQNQNLADSNAELAQDLRAKTYEMVTANKSRSEIVDFMVQRYGDFVLYKPPFKPETLILWLGPLLIFLLAASFAIRQVKGRNRSASAAEITENARREARKHLQDE